MSWLLQYVYQKPDKLLYQCVAFSDLPCFSLPTGMIQQIIIIQN